MKSSSSPKARRPRRKFRPIKAWALVAPGHVMTFATGGATPVFAIYPRRYLAAEAAGRTAGCEVVPVEIRSLKHRPR